MCWTSTDKPIKQIANEDVICYKILIPSREGRVVSPYFNYEYNYHKINDEITLNIYTTPTFENVFCVDLMYKIDLYKCDQGYHSYSSLDFAKKVCHDSRLYEKGACIFKCIIPKGSVFYENKRGEIVSSNIIIGVYDKDAPKDEFFAVSKKNQ